MPPKIFAQIKFIFYCLLLQKVASQGGQNCWSSSKCFNDDTNTCQSCHELMSNHLALGPSSRTPAFGTWGSPTHPCIGYDGGVCCGILQSGGHWQTVGCQKYSNARCNSLCRQSGWSCPLGYTHSNPSSGPSSDCQVACGAERYLCQPCPANTYGSMSGDRKHYCFSCPGVTTSPSGSTSVQQCVLPCDSTCGDKHSLTSPLRCASGQRLNTASHTCATGSCQSNQKHRCEACTPGTFMASTDHHHETCLTCELGEISLLGASSCTTCTASHPRCKGIILQEGQDECPAHNQLTLCQTEDSCTVRKSCTCNADSVKIHGVCVPCGDGTVPSTDQTVCWFCEPGKYKISGTTCTLCPAGKMSESSRGAHLLGSCADCPSGKTNATGYVHYRTDKPLFSRYNYFKNARCGSCSKGQFAHQATKCLDCALGQFQAVPMQIVCQNCETGKYTDMLKSTSCFNCYPGKSSTVGASSCALCSPGKFQNYESTEELSCQSCPVGKFSSFEGTIDCFPCSTALTSGETSCADGKCEAGTFSSTGNTPCASCTSGQFQAGRGSVACQNCPKGFFSEQSTNGCSACIAGKYGLAEQSTNESMGCANCPQGKWSSTRALVSIDLCAACSQGRWSDTTGRSINAECVSCSAGKWSSEFAATTNTSCVPCVAGKFGTKVGEKADTCVACPAGFFQELEGQPFCLPW